MERRAVQRTRAEVLVECHVRGRTELVETYDISTDGCMLQASRAFFCEVGDEIEIAIRGIELKGRVVWVRNRNAGVQFAGSTSLGTLAAIVAGDQLAKCLAVSSTVQAKARRVELAFYGLLALASTLLLLQ